MDIYIVHGYRAGVDRNWFPWLTLELAKQEGEEHQLTVIPLPAPQTPERDEWVTTVHNAIGVPTENTIIITHSLGGITTLDYLHSLGNDWNLGGLILVSPFLGKLPSRPALDTFLEKSVNIGTLIDKIHYISVIHSDNDPIVPPVTSIALGIELGAKIIEIPGGFHFLDTEGYTELPIVLSEVNEICSIRPGKN